MPDWQALVASLLVLWALGYSLRSLLPLRWRRAGFGVWSRWRGVAARETLRSERAGACGACRDCSSHAGAARPMPHGPAPVPVPIVLLRPRLRVPTAPRH